MVYYRQWYKNKMIKINNKCKENNMTKVKQVHRNVIGHCVYLENMPLASILNKLLNLSARSNSMSTQLTKTPVA